MQLRDSSAFNYIKSVVEDVSSVGETFKGVLKNYFRVVDPCKTDSNKRRWKMSRWYYKFLGNVEKISLFTKCESDYNLSKCENYVYKTAGNAVYTLIQIKGVDRFIKELKANKFAPALKYQELLNLYTDNKIKKFNGIDTLNEKLNSSDFSERCNYPQIKYSPYIWEDIHDVDTCTSCGLVVSARDDDDDLVVFNGKVICWQCYQNAVHKFFVDKVANNREPERNTPADELHIQSEMSD